LTIPRKAIIFAVSPLVVALVLMSSGVQARDNTLPIDCPEMPNVSWWGNTSPEKISAYVERKHWGDWSAYIKKWQKHAVALGDVYGRNKSAVIKSRGIVLKGDKLANYIKLINKRVQVVQCYAEKITAGDYLVVPPSGKQASGKKGKSS